MSSFGSFWGGTLSPYEVFCLSSFANKGHKVKLYSYEKISGIPSCIDVADAREIVDKAYIERFITDGKRNISHFSDYFRYLMFQKTNLSWIDTDILLLDNFEINPDESFLVSEDENNVCNAILRIPSKAPELAEIIDKTEQIFDRDVPWAATQNVIRKAYRKQWLQLGDKLHAPEQFMPVHYNDYYKLLLPEYFDECELLCRSSKTIHLYNNILSKIGYCKMLMPPVGSYLQVHIKNAGYDHLFAGSYPADVVRALAEGWRLRFSGDCVGAKSLVRQLLPSVRRTCRKLYWRYK